MKTTLQLNIIEFLNKLDCIVKDINTSLVELLLEFCIKNGGSNIGFEYIDSENEFLFMVVNGVKVEIALVKAGISRQFYETILNHYDFVAKEIRSPLYGDAFNFLRVDGTICKFRLFSPLMNGYYIGSGAYLFDVRQAQDCSKQVFARLLF